MTNKRSAINFSKVSKRYQRGQKRLLKEALLEIFKGSEADEFWALRNVSFDIKLGETVGVIGPNGSGKSTLLKLIAGVAHPTSGQVKVNGKVAPLIELGAGFHPELTGRENIFLNGSIMGLKRSEIESKYDDIVNFAELKEFIDTPVKYYSSGMYMRLGFSIAVHVEPEILLIDEILAVGDTAFQKKCLIRMQKFKDEGKTIVFISHDLETVRDFCERVLYINKGKLSKEGEPLPVMKQYAKDYNF